MSRASAVDLINDQVERGGLFWVAGLASELWPVLKDHLDDLHDSARMAVEHYMAHQNPCDGKECEGCR